MRDGHAYRRAAVSTENLKLLKLQRSPIFYTKTHYRIRTICVSKQSNYEEEIIK